MTRKDFPPEKFRQVYQDVLIELSYQTFPLYCWDNKPFIFIFVLYYKQQICSWHIWSNCASSNSILHSFILEQKPNA